MEGAVKKIKNLIKVVKVISLPKNVNSMEVDGKENIEKNPLVKMEDPDDFSAVESIKDEYIDGKLVHGRLYTWTENSSRFFLYLKPVEISKKCFNIT